MAKDKVLLLGATGETGGDILNGLIEDGNFVRNFSKLIEASLKIKIMCSNVANISCL